MELERQSDRRRTLARGDERLIPSGSSLFHMGGATCKGASCMPYALPPNRRAVTRTYFVPGGEWGSFNRASRCQIRPKRCPAGTRAWFTAPGEANGAPPPNAVLGHASRRSTG